jgi:intracellular multiplication protein IcmB
MARYLESFLDSIESFLAWLSSSLKQTTEAYCDLETADSSTVLVAHDGSLLSLIRVSGVTHLIGNEEFKRLHEGLTMSLQTPLSRAGHTLQVVFHHDRYAAPKLIEEMLAPSLQTSQRLQLALTDLFEERIKNLSEYCAYECVYFVLWTRPSNLTNEQQKRATREKLKFIREKKLSAFRFTQNVIASIPDLRDTHDAFIRSVLSDLEALQITASLLEVHEAVHDIRRMADPEFTDKSWKACLPGDKVPLKKYEKFRGHIADVLWPSLARQVLPRDAETLDLRTVRFGNRIYSCVFIDLLPKEVRAFSALLQRTLAAHIPWRISFLAESDALYSIKFKSLLATILSFSSSQNRLLSDANNLLHYIAVNSDEAIVKLQVAACTWAPEGQIGLLRTRTAELAKAIEGWGSCDVSEISGDPFEGLVSTLVGTSARSVATPTLIPFSEMVYLLPITRPASPWKEGAQLFRTPDGKPWPFQPGSSQQTAWIDLIYARPGSGKSVLSNTLNLALCLAGGQRLPRIAIIDIGPSSSGLISLLREALPVDQRHQVAYYRLQMDAEYAINPFDTQLGARFPSPQERSFLINFLSLLATPLGSQIPYDGMSDMIGLIIDELYKQFSDEGKAYLYTPNIELLIDGILEEIGFVGDARTTWWEVTDALFSAGFIHEAMLAQRYAMPLIADAASICRTPIIEDLYGKIKIRTGETLINAFSRMISSVIREYPILSRATCFDLDEARVTALDLDEVAKSGGEAADRQTAIMYMLARYILTRDYYLGEGMLQDIAPQYRSYHKTRIEAIREEPKRIVFDEFHRTAKAKAVRDQVLTDMREGRKWNIQIALLSQSLDDFDSVMVEFATSIYIMDAGPEQAIEKSAKIFGLPPTAKIALRTRVHGPRAGGATFLAQFASKSGVNTQLLTLTLGPVELWALSTTVEDAILRNKLYQQLGAGEARRVLARLFPEGSAKKLIEKRLFKLKESQGIIIEDSQLSVIDQLLQEILEAYSQNPKVERLVT